MELRELVRYRASLVMLQALAPVSVDVRDLAYAFQSKDPITEGEAVGNLIWDVFDSVFSTMGAANIIGFVVGVTAYQGGEDAVTGGGGTIFDTTMVLEMGATEAAVLGGECGVEWTAYYFGN